MKTALIGGGRGCLAVLELFVQGRLDILDMEIISVVDVDLDAPGSRFAAEQGWPTLTSIEQALALPGLELVIELTGADEVLDQIYSHLPARVRVMDHVMASVFWDLEKLANKQREQLQEKASLEARLASDRAELRTILDTIPDMVIVLDREMKILRSNSRFEQATGLSAAEAEQQLHRQAFSLHKASDNPVDFVAPFYSVIEKRRPYTEVQIEERDIEDRQCHSDPTGHERCWQVTANPIIDSEGEIVRVVQTAQEVTELVMLQRESEEQGQRFRQIVDAVHGIITIKDLEGRYQLVNPRAERLFGMTQKEMLGRTATELFPPQVAEEIEKNDERTLMRGAYQTTEEVLCFNQGERQLVAERFPLRDYRGGISAICCVARDMTRSRQLHEELVQSERLAAVGKLAAGVAHELNNPLTGILTFAEDLKLEAEQDDPLLPDYEVIVNEAMRCRGIVRDLLDYSRQKSPERQRVSVGPVVQRVLTMVERQATFHNIQFDVELDETLPQVYIDQRQIQQAILNLVINARDAMEGCGEISIRTERRKKEATVVISVKDHGCGIEKDRLDDIFQPFFSTKGDRGNGLGLPAVLSLAEQHRGTVEVDSQVGRGSTFRIVLPEAAERAEGPFHG